MLVADLLSHCGQEFMRRLVAVMELHHRRWNAGCWQSTVFPRGSGWRLD